jgi:hypothetical protein
MIVSRLPTYLTVVAVLVVFAVLGVAGDARAFLGSLFAAALSVSAVFFIEAQLRPHMTVKAEESPPTMPDGRVFLRVVVTNRSLGWPWNRIMDRRPALMTRAWITFLRDNNNTPFFRPGHRMKGRWSVTPEPVRAILIPTSASDELRIASFWDPGVTRDFVDVAPASSEPLDIVMRAPGETGCRGWHNGIIQRPDPPEDERFDLLAGTFRALVRVQTGGQTTRALFQIVNDVPLEHFRLEPLKMDPAIPDAW